MNSSQKQPWEELMDGAIKGIWVLVLLAIKAISLE